MESDEFPVGRGESCADGAWSEVPLCHRCINVCAHAHNFIFSAAFPVAFRNRSAWWETPQSDLYQWWHAAFKENKPFNKMYARMSILKIKVLKAFSSEWGILSPWGV